MGPAVYSDGLAGHEAPARTAQEAHHGRDVVRLAAFACDGAVGEMMRRRLRARRPAGVDRAWHHAIGGDAVGGEIVRQRARVADQSGLGGHYMRTAFRANMRAHAANIDDTAAVFRRKYAPSARQY